MFDLKKGCFSSLEKQLIDDLKAEKSKDPWASILLLCGSGQQITHLQQLLAHENEAFLNIHFLTLTALAERLLAEAPYPERIISEPAFYQEAIHQILAGDTPEPVDIEIRKALGIHGQTIPVGLTGALSATLKDLRDSGMRADHALRAAQEGFLGGEAPEAAPTLALYARMIGLFEKNELRSTADVLRRAAEEASTHPWLQANKAAYIYGFYDLNGVQQDLVFSLASHPNAKVYFPYEEGNPAYAFAEKLLKDPAFLTKCGFRNADFGITSQSDIRNPTSEIHLISCSGIRDEVWFAAKEILKLTDSGMAFGEIAVFSRNLSPYLGPLREIFNAHRIPYVAAQQELARAHPLIKKIRGEILRCSQDDSMLWLEHITWAKDHIASANLLSENPSDEESVLMENVLAALDSLEVLGLLSKRVDRSHFLSVLGKKLDQIERPGPALRHAGVQVLNIQQARGLSFKAVFVLGMNEKVFPRLIREDPFLSDKARSALSQTTGSRLGRKLDGYEEERLLFQLTRQAATEHLTLLTQRSDENGKALIPSTYLRELERMLARPQVSRLPRSWSEKFQTLPVEAWTPKEMSVLLNRSNAEPEELYAALGWDTKAFAKLISANRSMDSFKGGLGVYDGVIGEPALLKPTLNRPFSPLSLEDLAECPFEYYAAHVLRVAPPQPLAPEGEITPIGLGKIFHKTLELFYTACRDQGLPSIDSELKTRLKETLEAGLLEFVEGLSTLYPVVLKSIKGILYQDLYQFLKTDIEEIKSSGFVPTHFEQTLEGKLSTSGLPYGFWGRPDRIDERQNNGAMEKRVVDYKSGKPKPWSGRLETHIIQGRYLQLPIYLALASATSASLRPVRDPDPDAQEKRLAADFWQRPAASLFIENLQEVIGIVEKGRFFIEPSLGEWGYCAHCNFARICRKEHIPTRLRAERDPFRQRVIEKLSRVAPKETAPKEETVGP